jgi:proteasome activator subunit 4
MFYHKDPRRLQPLVDYVLQEFKTTDYNGESSFEATKILSLLRATYEQLNWKFTAFLPQVIDRIWKEKNSDHIDVRAHVAEVMAFSSKISASWSTFTQRTLTKRNYSGFPS